MAEFQYSPINGFRDEAGFPNPTTETAARAQVQSLMDQARDAINDVDTDLQAEKGLLTTHKGSSDHDGRYYTEAEADAIFATSEEVQAVVLGQVPDGSLTPSKLSFDPATQVELDGHKTDLLYQLAGGTATAITLTTSTLVDGYTKTLIASATSTSTSKTINGKPFYKLGTTLSPSTTIGKAYTVWYDLAGDCFFFKASSEGNVTVDKVLAGYTFSNDSDTGLVGEATVGSLGGKRFATGISNGSGTTIACTFHDGTNGSCYYITVSGLTFLPSYIILFETNNPATYQTLYNKNAIYNSFEICIAQQSLTTFQLIRKDGTNIYVSSSGFRIPSRYNGNVSWLAIE